jgi:serine/threonine protein kinase
MGTRIKANEKVNYVENSQFVLDRKYTDLKLIGKGSYGVVVKAKDASRNMSVAIKKITPMAKTVVDAKHVLREVRIMRHMGKHENIITIEDIVVREANDELYIIMELFDSDLHQVIQSSQVLTEPHHRHFMHQLMCGVKYLHDNRIIHRDLKPGNLLVSRSCALRITDFGLARERAMGRSKGDDPAESIDEPMTEHVITRWYRPPELMLCPDGLYTYAVDIWSCGCIFAEMLKRKALFPGKNFIDQLSRIFDVIGSPNALEVAHIENAEALKFLESQKKKQKFPLNKFFPGVPGPAVTLIDGMLQFDPSNRLVINEILLSQYFTNVPRTSQSMVFPPTAPDFNFDFERQELSKYQLRQLILAEHVCLKRANDERDGVAPKEDSGIAVGARERGVDREEKAAANVAVAAAKKRVADSHLLPKSTYGESRAEARRGSGRHGQPTGVTEDGSDVLKPRVRSNSNPRAGHGVQREASKQAARPGGRRDSERDSGAVDAPTEREQKRAASGLRARPSAAERAPPPARAKTKEPLVVAGKLLADDDDMDAAIEADYKAAKSWLEQGQQ